jgi:hypothetical protein
VGLNSPSGLRRGSAADRPQGSNPAEGMDVCAVCCRGISDMRIKDTSIKIQSG